MLKNKNKKKPRYYEARVGRGRVKSWPKFGVSGLLSSALVEGLDDHLNYFFHVSHPPFFICVASNARLISDVNSLGDDWLKSF